MESRSEPEKTRDIRERLARIEGQVRGISKMVDARRPCDQVLLQVIAVRAALEQVAGLVVTGSIDECLLLPPTEARKALDSAIGLLTRM